MKKSREQQGAPGALSVEEASDYMRVSRATTYRLLREGSLPRARIGGRTVIRRIDLDKFLDKCIESA